MICGEQELRSRFQVHNEDENKLKINGNDISLSIYMYFYPLFLNDLDIGVNFKVKKITIL